MKKSSKALREISRKITRAALNEESRRDQSRNSSGGTRSQERKSRQRRGGKTQISESEFRDLVRQELRNLKEAITPNQLTAENCLKAVRGAVHDHLGNRDADIYVSGDDPAYGMPAFDIAVQIGEARYSFEHDTVTVSFFFFRGDEFTVSIESLWHQETGEFPYDFVPRNDITSRAFETELADHMEDAEFNRASEDRY